MVNLSSVVRTADSVGDHEDGVIVVLAAIVSVLLFADSVEVTVAVDSGTAVRDPVVAAAVSDVAVAVVAAEDDVIGIGVVGEGVGAGEGAGVGFGV
jgi:hypothetical protein